MKVLIKATNEIKEVADAYAVNYLIPKGLAVMATSQVLNEYKQQEAKKQQESEAKLQRQNQLSQELNGKTIKIKAKANAEGELYGSIGKQQIKKALKSKDPLEFKLDEPIKKTGKYPLDIKIGKHLAKVTIEVVS